MSKRGYSLTELLVVMGMTSVAFTVGVGMVHRVMHEQKFANRDNAMHRVAERLSMRLREDVLSAERAELIPPDDEGKQRLVLNQPGEGIVTYAVLENVLERASTREDEQTHRDSFRFPDNYRLQFLDIRSQRVTFTAYAFPKTYMPMANELPEEEIESDVRRAVMRVEATVGRDHRFRKRIKDSSES